MHERQQPTALPPFSFRHHSQWQAQRKIDYIRRDCVKEVIDAHGQEEQGQKEQAKLIEAPDVGIGRLAPDVDRLPQEYTIEQQRQRQIHGPQVTQPSG